MALKVTVTISDEGAPGPLGPASTRSESGKGVVEASISPSEVADDLEARVKDIRRQVERDRSPFPEAGVDGFLSHFIIAMEIFVEPGSSQLLSFTMPPALQTVARSAPFRYAVANGSHERRVSVPLPPGCSLSPSIAESDFSQRPGEYFEEGTETVWMQILNLDAKMDSDIGTIRIILGETLKREYPDLFQPSLGIAQSLNPEGGFPARLFFNPYAIIETPLGSMRAIHGTLAYGRITQFPPVGTPVTICETIPLEGLEDVRKAVGANPLALRAAIPDVRRVGRIIALSHPIDVPMQISGEDAFQVVERSIETKRRPATAGVAGGSRTGRRRRRR